METIEELIKKYVQLDGKRQAIVRTKIEQLLPKQVGPSADNHGLVEREFNIGHLKVLLGSLSTQKQDFIRRRLDQMLASQISCTASKLEVKSSVAGDIAKEESGTQPIEEGPNVTQAKPNDVDGALLASFVQVEDDEGWDFIHSEAVEEASPTKTKGLRDMISKIF